MTHSFTRRNFTKHMIGGLATTALVACNQSTTSNEITQSTETKELRMLMGWPSNFPGLGTSANRFAKRVSEASNGSLTIKIFGAGEIVPTFEVLDAVASGAGDMTHDTSYYWFGKDPAFVYFAVVPFGMTADEHFTWLKFGGGQELWDELGAEHGVKPLAVLNTGGQMGGWFKEEIKSIDDLRGKKLRYPGLGGKMLEELGAVPTNIPGGELFTALQKGTIDGLEWIAPWNDLAFGFHRAAKHYYYPGFHEMGHCISSYVNLDVWNNLSDNHKSILQTAADAEYITSLAEYNARNLTALNTLVEEHGVLLHEWPNEIIEAVHAMTPRIMAENANQSPMAAKVSASWTASLDQQSKWGEISDYRNIELKRKR